MKTKDVIKVHGNIIVATDKPWFAKSIKMFSSEVENKNETYTVNDYNRLTIHTEYIVAGSIVAFSIGSEDYNPFVLSNPQDVIDRYRKTIYFLNYKNETNNNIPYDKETEQILRSQLLISIFGSLELFLAEYLAVMTIGIKENYDKFRKESKLEIPFKDMDLIELNPYSYIFNLIKSGILYHRFNDVKKLYRSCINHDPHIPKEIFNIIKLRHDVVHRFGSDKYKIDNTTIDELIKYSNEIVDSLEVKHKDIIDNW